MAPAMLVDPNPIKISSFKTIKQVACGRAHALMIADHDLLFAMGDNSDGQLGACPAETASASSPILVEGFCQSKVT